MTLDRTRAEIRDAFMKMNSKDDFILLLNMVKPLFSSEDTPDFSLKEVNWYSNQKLGGSRYIDFTIKKKSGALRHIHAPVNKLKLLQKIIAFVLECLFEPHNAAMGFVTGKSIVDNASVHTNKRYVYNIDLKDFFTSVEQARIWKCLQLKPFNLCGGEKIEIEYYTEDLKETISNINPTHYRIVKGSKGYYLHLIIKEDEVKSTYYSFKLNTEFDTSLSIENYIKHLIDTHEVLITNLNNRSWYTIQKKDQKRSNSYISDRRLELANLIAGISCTEMEVERLDDVQEWIKVKRNVLPQGAPTSPIITNIVCQRLDFLLTGVAKRFGLSYSRYADDITFSSMHNVYHKDGEFIKELTRIIKEQGFYIKDSKTRLQKDGYKKEVTGLLVNEKVNIPKRYIKDLRMWLYYWEHYGYERTYHYFFKHYRDEKGHVKKGRPDMINVISGKLDYLKMVLGVESGVFNKLKLRFDALTKDDKKDEITIPQQNISGRLRININSTDNSQYPVSLKRRIIINKGEKLPLEDYIDNNEYEERDIDLSKHKPIDVNKLLISFKSGEGLKFLTHNYDVPGKLFNHLEIISTAKKEFSDLTKRLLIPQNLWARINQFAFGEPQKSWSFNKKSYSFNWNSPELLTWMNENPNIHPINNDFYEKNFITPFKKSIEIKAPDLEEIVRNKLAESLGSKYSSFEIENIKLDQANFYTNVDALLTGISYLLRSIKQRFDNSNKIRIEYSSVSDVEGRKRMIKIIHVNSTCNKPLDKKELFQGDFLEAEKAFFGICDWSIISKSPDDSCNKLNILFDIASNKQVKEKIDESTIIGFTHVLTFYS